MYSRPQAYLLQNQVTHARLLPKEAAHAFTYPTLAFLVSLKALEGGQLDLAKGWVFSYGGKWGRMTGLRPRPYLNDENGSILGKLNALLKSRGYLNDIEDAWMMTMPSFMGVEGINPLTVYFCYDTSGLFCFTVLEIHNTFGESHVHVLQIGKDEAVVPPRGYDHEWTFRREFHVSPFNDRSGSYTVSVKSPTHSPMQSKCAPEKPPRPAVRVHLYTDDHVLKLTALLRPTHATALTTPALLRSVAKAPFGWLLTFPRILLVAWKLHYQKRLDVFLRPEPQPAPAGGVKWLPEGMLERFARRRLETHLRRRTEEMGVEVTLVSADMATAPHTFSPGRPSREKMVVSYLAPRFFTIMFLAPSAEHALLLGCDSERIFNVSDRVLFSTVFAGSAQDKESLQKLRLQDIPPQLEIPLPKTHYLDDRHSSVLTGLIIYYIFFIDWLERMIFTLARARVVNGSEPWKQWDRAAMIHLGEPYKPRQDSNLGSVRRL